MKRFWPVVLLLMLAIPAAAQMNTGNIAGLVVDQEGTPLPGVTVLLTHGTMAPLTVMTTEVGAFRFRGLFPAVDYAVRAELQGFKPVKQTDIIVAIGGTTDIKLVLEQGKIEEQVTVVAVSPIVQTKKTSISTSMNYTALQALPSARTPWVVLQMAPAVVMDREDVGGNESGQQSTFIARGQSSQTGRDDQWNLDGVVITDQSSGGSPGYYDFDIFEELQVTSGGMDVETQTGGILLNMVTRRGGNRLSIGGRNFFTDNIMQSNPSIDTIRAKGITTTPGYNKIMNVKDYGVNLGGPIIKDRLWLWGSFGVQDIKTNVLVGSRDDSLLTNIAAKINFQIIPENRAEFFLHLGNKEKWGRSATAAYPPGLYQMSKYALGSPLYKFQDEQMFGDNLFITLKASFQDSGFGMFPMDDRDLLGVSSGTPALNRLVRFNQTTSLQEGSTWTYYDRPGYNGNLIATYYNDNLFGVGHEFKLGFDYSYRQSKSQIGYPGNMYVNYNYNTQQADFDLNGTRDIPPANWYRLYFMSNSFGYIGEKAFAGYINDTVSFGRFNVRLGVRFDRQHPFRESFATFRMPMTDRSERFMTNDYEISQAKMTAGTPEAIDRLWPAKSAPAVNPDWNWDFWSPRIGLTWDMFGNGKTLMKLNFAKYGAYMGDVSGYWAYSGLGGNMNFWWNDGNNDGKVDYRELYWYNSVITARPIYRVFDDAGNYQWDLATANRELSTFWSGWEWATPLSVIPPLTYTDLDSSFSGQNHTMEMIATLEREIIPDFAVSVNFTWRRFDNYTTTLARFAGPDGLFNTADDTIRSNADYESLRTVPSTLTDPGTGTTYSTGAAAGRPWYTLANGDKNVSTNYARVFTIPSGRYNQYMGVDLVFNKRFSHKWMFNGSFTYQWQKAHYLEDWYMNVSDLWAYQDEPYNYNLGAASGKIAQPAFIDWMAKLTAMYQLPWDFNVSLNVTARQGWVNPVTFGITDLTLPNARSQNVTMPLSRTSERDRLPIMAYGNLKIEKMLRLGNTGRIYISADIFNVLNSLIVNRQYAKYYGLFTFQTNGTQTYAQTDANQGTVNEVLNPRIARIGIRFEF
jgi:hypothetical protein